MKAMIVCGSAERKGVTHRMCNEAARFLQSQGWEVEFYMIAEMYVGHCKDCGLCKDGTCPLKDDMNELYESFPSTDLLILSTPIHFCGPSSILKTVIDRFQPFWERDLPHPKKCFLMMCGGGENPDFGTTEKIVKAVCATAKMDYAGSVRIAKTDSEDADINDVVLKGLKFISDMA